MRANKEFTRKREMNNAIANVSDDELITLIRKGHEAAFEALIARHRNAIVAHATRILRDQDEAETAAQEVALRLYRNIDQFKRDARFTTWLYRITENVCRTMLAKAKREQEKVTAFSYEREDAHVDLNVRDAYAFDRLLAPLADDERQLLVLRFVQDKEIRDIAVIMGNGLSATKMRMYRALAKVRASFEDLAEAA